MSTGFWVFAVVLAVVFALVVVFLAPRTMQRRRLRERFGPEYERAITEEGDRRAAERRLTAVAKRRESLDIRPLPEHDRQAFAVRWNEIQSDFVDQPASATSRADRLIVEVMQARGYPIEDEDFDARADLLATDHSQVVADYREADALRKRNREPGTAADTEELRAAIVRYRALFERLLRPDATQDPGPGYADLGSDRGAGDSVGRRFSGRRGEPNAPSAVLSDSARGRAGRSHSG